MIYTYVPYCPEGEGKPPGKDVGLAMNRFMEKLGDDDWAFMHEHDCLFTTQDWYRRMERHAKARPEAGFFSPLRYYCDGANSYLAPMGRAGEDVGRDVCSHFSLGWNLSKVDDRKLEPIPHDVKTPPSSLWLISKRVWKDVGGFGHGWKGLDRAFSRKVLKTGRECFVMKDIYIAHFKGLQS